MKKKTKLMKTRHTHMHYNCQLTFGMLVAQCLFSHVTQSDGPFAAGINELIAVDRVELGSSDDFRQFLHVGWFDVHDVWDFSELGNQKRKKEQVYVCARMHM